MGCMYFKSKKTESAESKELISEKKEYSWDKRQKLDPKDYTIENIDDGESIRLPGTVDGRQFIIQNCKDARVLVLDYCNSITIDDCVNCIFILGPTTGSLFLRSCENCIVVALCGQFRARDCQKLTTFLCCPSQPTIESCCKVRCGCCLMYYKGLEEQMKKAGQSCFNNQWNLVYDFTPVPSEGPNWSLISSDNLKDIFLGFGELRQESTYSIGLMIGNVSRSLVPLTSGNNLKLDASDENCLVTIRPGDNQVHIASDFIASMTNLDGRFELVETREQVVGLEQARHLLQGPGPSPNPLIDAQVLLVGMHFRGPGCINKCQQVAAHLALSPMYAGQIHVSSNTKDAVVQIQHFMSSSGNP